MSFSERLSQIRENLSALYDILFFKLFRGIDNE